MGKTHRKNKTFTEVDWDGLGEYVADAYHSRKEAKRRGGKKTRSHGDEPDEEYGSFQKIGKRKCPKNMY